MLGLKWRAFDNVGDLKASVVNLVIGVGNGEAGAIGTRRQTSGN